MPHRESTKDEINVVVTIPLDSSLLRRIGQTHESVRVVDLSRDWGLAEVGDTRAGARVERALSIAEVMFLAALPPNLVVQAPRLRWVQSYSTGVDRVLSDATFAASSIVLTNMTGLHETAIAEYVIQVMLMFVRETPRCFSQKVARRWEWFPIDTLESKTVGIVGYGRIGRAVCKLCKAFDMRTVAIDRHDRFPDPKRCLDQALGKDQLDDLLAMSDFVVVCLPLTNDTRGSIAGEQIACMQPSSRLIVVSRGHIVDEEALAIALRSGAIAGAALDVFAEEPLPADSPLWQIDNLIFSPHNAGDVKNYDAPATELFCRNLTRYAQGEPLENVVDKSLGF